TGIEATAAGGVSGRRALGTSVRARLSIRPTSATLPFSLLSRPGQSHSPHDFPGCADNQDADGEDQGVMPPCLEAARRDQQRGHRGGWVQRPQRHLGWQQVPAAQGGEKFGGAEGRQGSPSLEETKLLPRSWTIVRWLSPYGEARARRRMERVSFPLAVARC